MAEFIFWLTIALMIYSLVGYPLLMCLLALFMKRTLRRDDTIRSVEIIIPVHNGAAALPEKIRNCLELDYPPEALTIRVVSDGSTDDTVPIARRYGDRGVECIPIAQRVGKGVALNQAFAGVSSEVVILTDLHVRVRPDAVRCIVSNFADPSVGVVTCHDHPEHGGEAGFGESLYLRYDMIVRRCANRTRSLVGVTGGFFAVRREVTEGGWNPDYPPDLHAALRAITMSLGIVVDERVAASYATTPTLSGELQRKIRTITRGIWAVLGYGSLLNPFRYGLISIQLLSYKIMRWLMPFLLVSLLASNTVALLNNPASLHFQILLLGQGIFYASAALGLTRVAANPVVKRLTVAAAFALLANVAIARSWINILRKRRFTVWQPTPRNMLKS